jgi:hypothetical protein
MDYIRLSRAPSGIAVDDYPNAVRVVAVQSDAANRLQDLALHERDLTFARTCLDAIPKVADELGVVHRALWRSAIVHFMKCFGRGARMSLRPDAIYAGVENAADAMQRFEYFSTLRNMHVVHDVNDYMQAATGAIINKPGAPHKVEKVVCASLVAETFTQANYDHLRMLIATAANWVRDRFDELATQITAELEVVDYDRLISMPSLTQVAPRVETIERARKQPQRSPL